MKTVKKYNLLKVLYSLLFFCFICLSSCALVFAPTGLFFIFLDRLGSNPGDFMNIFNVLIGLVVLPIVQIYWLIFCSSLLDSKKTFLDAIVYNHSKLEKFIIEFHKILWNIKEGD